MANFQEVAHKKVLGVPVIYLAGGFVVILALVAWKLKPSTSGDTTTDTTGGDTNTGLAPTANPYDSLNPDGDGTVTVQQLGPAATTEPVVKTNSDWVNEGAVWLNKNKNVPGSAALAALNKYVNGEDKSYDEQQWIDAWFAQDGPPPDGVAEGGTTGPKPSTTTTPSVQRQFTSFPGVHVIKGGADNGYTGLAKLYYNSTAGDRIDLLQAANTNLGPSGPWAIGTKVTIPAYHAPVIYIVPSTMSEAQVYAKNGITRQQFEVLNNGYKGTYHKGDRVRVK